MINLEKLSISWIDEIKTSNNQVVIKAIALDKIVLIECTGIVFISLHYPKEFTKSNKIEIGNVIEVSHAYQPARVKDIPQFSYNYELDKPSNIIRIEGDYVIKLICQHINVATLE
ncbi:hypothetical protein [Snodgrassella communis]|jgi:hypothetical protein|uniref:hypothetical protein n=1 Tax=Snodgrassella communis TaxID=2946699 RepID=UPI000563BB30|nr:hypothetical protein [Snodgrassella communis]PIT21402.1 hypothetical protein BGI35_05760 [Snodgrassella communis]